MAEAMTPPAAQAQGVPHTRREALRGHAAMLAFSVLIAGSFSLGARVANLIDPVAITALRFVLADGREISAPLEWFPRLRDASVAQRLNWRLIGKGIGVHWPDIDEDVAVSTLMESR